MKTIWTIGCIITFLPICILEVLNIPIAGVRYLFGNKTIFQRTPLKAWNSIWNSRNEL